MSRQKGKGHPLFPVLDSWPGLAPPSQHPWAALASPLTERLRDHGLPLPRIKGISFNQAQADLCQVGVMERHFLRYERQELALTGAGRRNRHVP